jgi:hypothetical protein
MFNSVCTAMIQSLPQGPANMCNAVNFGTPGSFTVYRIGVPKVMATCSPSGGQATLPPPAWDAVGLACGGAAPGAGCAAGEICSPPPPSPFLPKACIFQAGSQVCPTAYPEKHTFSGVADSRACSPCTCSATQTTCSGTTTFYPDSACAQPAIDSHADDGGACAGVMGIVQGLRVDTTLMGPTTCASAGGQPVGMLGPDGNVTTFCCTIP